jgi:class 3 adenylate cyclase
MDPATIGALASGVVAVLAPYLAKAGEEFAKEVGKTASSKMGALYQAVKARLHGHPAAAKALADLEVTPDDEDAQAALRLQLKKQMEADGAFADTLRRLLEEIGRDEQTATFLTQVYGGEVGKIINIGQAGEVLIE